MACAFHVQVLFQIVYNVALWGLARNVQVDMDYMIPLASSAIRLSCIVLIALKLMHRCVFNVRLIMVY